MYSTNEQNELAVIIGKTFLSLSEINNLKINDIIKLNSIAGEPFKIYFNFNYLCDADLVSAEDIACIMVTGKTSGNDFIDYNGVMDDITELLPVDVIMIKKNLSFKRIIGLGKNSIISTGEKYRKYYEAELIVYGKTAAYGRVLVLGENFGLQITKICNPISNESKTFRASGNLFKPDSIRFKEYDFTRPDKVTYKCIINMGKIHQAFLNNLKFIFQELNNYKITSIDQMTFSECKKFITDDSFKHFVVKQDGYSIKKHNGLSDKTKSKLIEPDDAELKLSDKFKDFLRNQNNPDAGKYLFFSINKNSFLCNINEKSINELILSPLRNGWKLFDNFYFDYKNKNDKINEIDFVRSQDMVIIAVIGTDTSPNEMIFVYPYVIIEPCISSLNY